MTLAESVKQRARELGFAPVGIATAEPFIEDEARSLAWLEAGLNAGLDWMTPERQQRACRPGELLPHARSLIVVGASYASSASTATESTSADERPTGRVARSVPPVASMSERRPAWPGGTATGPDP